MGGDKTVFRGRGNLGQLYVAVNFSYFENWSFTLDFVNSQHKIQINLLNAVVKFNVGWCVKYNTIKIVWNSGSYFIVDLFLFNKKYFLNIGSFLEKYWCYNFEKICISSKSLFLCITSTNYLIPEGQYVISFRVKQLV